MRISDWSSDVCSSDLGEFLDLPQSRRGLRRVGPPQVPCDNYDKRAAIYQSHRPSRLRPADQMNGLGRSIPTAPPLANCGSLGGLQICCAVLINTRPNKSRSEEHTSELQSLMRTSYAVFCLKKKK